MNFAESRNPIPGSEDRLDGSHVTILLETKSARFINKCECGFFLCQVLDVSWWNKASDDSRDVLGWMMTYDDRWYGDHGSTDTHSVRRYDQKEGSESAEFSRIKKEDHLVPSGSRTQGTLRYSRLEGGGGRGVNLFKYLKIQAGNPVPLRSLIIHSCVNAKISTKEAN